jgi:hypothetical protein
MREKHLPHPPYPPHPLHFLFPKTIQMTITNNPDFSALEALRLIGPDPENWVSARLPQLLLASICTLEICTGKRRAYRGSGER